MNLVTPMVGLLNKTSFLATAFGVTKFTIVRDMKSHFVVLLKSNLDVQQTHL
jgi:hypothetical protein